MSLLLALTGGAGPPTVDCTVASSQAQGAAGTLARAVDCTAAVSQAQGSTATLARVVASTAASAQAQGATATLALALSSTAAASQAQGATGTFARALDSTAEASQAQSAAATTVRALDSVQASSQSQSAIATTQVSDAIIGGGGYPTKHPWIHFPDFAEVSDLKPELADAVIEAVALVVEKRTVQDKGLDTAKAEKELKKYLKSQEQKWKNEYAQLILLEYERREQEFEDAQIAMMLFEM